MVGRAQKRAASSVAASLAMVTAALILAGPVLGASAAADPVDPCDPGQNQNCDPVVTVTITETPTPTKSPTPTGDPVVTATVTVTPTPKHTKTTKTTTAPPPQGHAEQPPVLPTTTAIIPPPQENPPATTEPPVSLAPASQQPSVVPTPSVSFEEPASEAVPYEIRNATPDFDQVTLSRKLAAPAALLVLLALLAWLVFEGRLRRMAHAAAVRKAGPRVGRPQGAPEDFAGYPAGPGYAPMVGFVPIQAYPMQPPMQPGMQPPYGYPQQPYGYPQAYGYPPPYPVIEQGEVIGEVIHEDQPGDARQ
ncbi:hypothetical protein N5079_20880 [Planotetraspora sp. A-T 1434]|uniref:hypothetical protein n=1 Tax=Planotetraspora sp. A-T 1434 TaxID=2979219 RepID=UPI0021BFA87B|nr:hypothetical protein [Planotetraspora sp. A-T 1434]MCT9932660.1 hypothetical protein [Planotetraspora sp. A-T 1434]